MSRGYVFDDLQSARIEQLRMAMRGFSQIAHGGPLDEEPIEIDRAHMAAIFELFDDRLGDVIGPDAVRSVWFEPGQPGAVPEPEQPEPGS